MTSLWDWSVMSTDSAEVMHPLHARQSVSDISAFSSFCFFGSFVVVVMSLEVDGFEEVETS